MLLICSEVNIAISREAWLDMLSIRHKYHIVIKAFRSGGWLQLCWHKTNSIRFTGVFMDLSSCCALISTPNSLAQFDYFFVAKFAGEAVWCSVPGLPEAEHVFSSLFRFLQHTRWNRMQRRQRGREEGEKVEAGGAGYRCDDLHPWGRELTSVNSRKHRWLCEAVCDFF